MQERKNPPYLTIVIIELILCVTAFLMLYYMYDSENVDIQEFRSESSVNLTDSEVQDLEKRYLEINPYSKSGLIKEITTREKINEEQAEKTVNSLDVDWNEQALKEAEELLKFDGYSERMIRENLENDGFTEEQAKYAVENCDADWNEQALKKAKIYRASGIGKENIRANLMADGFTEEQSTYGANNAL